jgi:hypothetical protein
MDMSFIECDPYVEQAMEELWGMVPPDLPGYTRSGASLKGLYDSLARYDVEYKAIPRNDPDFTLAVNITRAAFDPGEKVKLCDIDDVRFKPNTSAGWTFLGSKKRDVAVAARKEAKKLSRLAKRGRLSKAAMPPAVAFVRTQLAEIEKPKVRLVWGIPFEIILWEGQFIQPLLDVYDERDIPMPWGMKMLKQLPILIDNLFLKGKGVGLDWSNFDGPIGPEYLRLGYQILGDYLDMDADQRREYEKFVDYAIKTPIVMPNGYVYMKQGGIASGLYSTQVLGSLLNHLFIKYLQIKLFKEHYYTHVLGDDSAFAVPRDTEVDLTKMALLAKYLLGMTLNTAKSVVAETPDEFTFLGHSSEYGKVARDESKVLRLALYPEREVRSPAQSVGRVQGILIDTGFKDGRLFNLYQYMVNKYKEVAPLDERSLAVVFNIEVPEGVQPLYELWLHS